MYLRKRRNVERASQLFGRTEPNLILQQRRHLQQRLFFVAERRKTMWVQLNQGAVYYFSTRQTPYLSGLQATAA